MNGYKYYWGIIDMRWLIAFLLLFFLGMTVAVRQAPFSMNDEGAHYLRAYEVSNFHLINFRNNVGVDISCDEYLIAAKKYQLTPNIQKKAEDGWKESSCKVRSINTAGTYSFVPYIPSALALFVTERLGWKTEDKLVAARAANFAVWFTVLFFGLLLLKKGRILMVCLVLMPSFFWQLVALSADGSTFAFCLIYIFFIVSIVQQRMVVTLKLFKTLLLVAALIGASKGVYSPLALLSFALWDRLPYKGYFYRLKVCGTPTLVALGVFLLLTGLADPSLVYLGNGANPAMQMAGVLADPISFADIIFQTLLNTDVLGLVAPTSAVPNAGRAFGIMVMAGVTSAILLLYSDFGVDTRFRVVAALVFMLLLIAIGLPLYLTYSPVGGKYILGLQGRYYLPLIPLAFIAVAVNVTKIDRIDLFKRLQSKSEWVAVIPLLGLILACVNIK
jgi:uncharacterized membrane protein